MSLSTHDFTAKNIVITGSTGGLGREVVAAFLQQGAICHLPVYEPTIPSDIPWANHQRAQATTNIDLTNEQAVSKYFAGLPPLWASIHLAGGFAMQPIHETTVENLNYMWKLNTVTCFLCCREASKKMATKTTTSGGRIVNVAARPVLQATGGMIAYTSSKAAVANITQSLATELLEANIWVNAVVPSIIDTPVNRDAMPKANFDTWPKPHQIAHTIAFLASESNHYTTGSLVPVYGRA